jgi:hypothetical protein
MELVFEFDFENDLKKLPKDPELDEAAAVCLSAFFLVFLLLAMIVFDLSKISS